MHIPWPGIELLILQDDTQSTKPHQSGLLCPFLNCIVYLSVLGIICIFWILNSYQITWFANIFSHSMGCLFTFLMVLFDPQVFSLDEVQFICFPFVACAFVVIFKKPLPYLGSVIFPICLLLRVLYFSS